MRKLLLTGMSLLGLWMALARRRRDYAGLADGHCRLGGDQTAYPRANIRGLASICRLFRILPERLRLQYRLDPERRPGVG